MKIFACSDIHLDTMPVKERSIEAAGLPPSGEIDVLVIAGDLGRVRQQSFKTAVRTLCKTYPHVVFVAGNHEFYGSRPPQVLSILRMLSEQVENFHWLEHRTMDIGGVRFMGTTLWFETATPLPVITDFSVIRQECTWFREMNRRARAFLDREMTPESIVITHHSPAREFALWLGTLSGFPIADYYCSPSAQLLIEKHQPRLWIHGHIHHFFDQKIGKTRVICNPRGYPGEETFYDNHLILSL